MMLSMIKLTIDVFGANLIFVQYLSLLIYVLARHVSLNLLFTNDINVIFAKLHPNKMWLKRLVG